MPLRRVLGISFATLVVGVGGAACGSDDDDAQPQVSSDVPALELEGDATRGRKVWADAGCSACHTLAATNATGTVVPNLDQSRPTFELVANRVTLGRRAMPMFRGLLTPQQIADVAEFVSTAAGGDEAG